MEEHDGSMDDLLGMGRPSNAAAVRRIKSWVREAAGLGDDCTVMVSELRCREPGCPEIETVVAVMRAGQAGRKVTFECAIDQLSRDMVEARFAE